MVSSKGFTRTARKKAEALAITCMDLESVETYDWLSMDFMFGYKRQFGSMNVRVMFRDDGPSSFTGLINHEGQELTDDEVGSLVAGHVPAAAQPDTEVGVTFPVHMRLNVEGWTVVDQEGVVWPIDHIQVDTSIETFREAIPVTKHRYSGGGKEYRFASATIPPSIASGGRVVFMQRDEGDVDVFWVPEPKAPE